MVLFRPARLSETFFCLLFAPARSLQRLNEELLPPAEEELVVDYLETTSILIGSDCINRYPTADSSTTYRELRDI